MSNKENKYILRTYRFPPSILIELGDHLALHPQKEADFVRDAIKEKLSRTKITEDLDIKVDTGEVQKILLKNQEKFDQQLTLFKDIVASLNERLNAKLDKQLDLIQDILARSLLTEKTDTKEQTINIEQEILDILPAKIEDIQLKYGIEEANNVINNLKSKNIIKFAKGVWKRNV